MSLIESWKGVFDRVQSLQYIVVAVLCVLVLLTGIYAIDVISGLIRDSKRRRRARAARRARALTRSVSYRRGVLGYPESERITVV